MRGLATRSALLAVLAIAALAPAAGAVLVHLPDGRFAGVFPRAGVNPASVPGSLARRSVRALAADDGTVQYNGGPVLHSSSPYLIFWAPPPESIPGAGESLMARYLSDVAAASGASSNVYGVIRQYSDGESFANYSQSFSASHVIVDTQGYPGLDLTCHVPLPPANHCVSDAQLQSEITRLIGAGHLPTGTGPGAPIYFVVTPPDVNVCMSLVSCTDSPTTGFCAYHSDFTIGGQEVVYASLPYFDTTPDPKACQQDGTGTVQEPNADVADIMIDNLSHENSESITDPLGTAWFDGTSSNEIADNCESYGSTPDPANGVSPNAYSPALGGSSSAGTLYDQLIGGHAYYTQSEWSNGDLGCELKPAGGRIVPRFSVPRPGKSHVGRPVLFDPATSTSTSPIAAAAWSFGDGTQALITTSPGAATHAYGAAGRYTATLTLIDDHGNVATTAQRIVVGSPPRASFRFSPRHHPGRRVRFHYTGKSDPDRGVKIVSYRWSFGDGSHSHRRNPTHHFARRGTFTVTLTVTNSLGITKTVRHKLKIRR